MRPSAVIVFGIQGEIEEVGRKEREEEASGEP